MKEEELLEIAKAAVERSYSPYSKVRVCAVLCGEDGIFTGVNVENSSYGLTVCAERIAVFKAVSEGKRKFSRMLVYSPDVVPFPCGACRQVMAEFFSGNFEVIVASSKEVMKFKLSQLLPYTFKL